MPQPNEAALWKKVVPKPATTSAFSPDLNLFVTAGEKHMHYWYLPSPAGLASLSSNSSSNTPSSVAALPALEPAKSDAKSADPVLWQTGKLGEKKSAVFVASACGRVRNDRAETC